MEDESNSEILRQALREFIDNYYRSLGNGAHVLIKFFSKASILDQLYIENKSIRTTEAQNIANILSTSYKYGINTQIKALFHQPSPLLPYLFVTVSGLFKYNGLSWPFLHVYHITASMFGVNKFAITNSVLYDCVNPSQINDDPIVSHISNLNITRHGFYTLNENINEGLHPVTTEPPANTTSIVHTSTYDSDNKNQWKNGGEIVNGFEKNSDFQKDDSDCVQYQNNNRLDEEFKNEPIIISGNSRSHIRYNSNDSINEDIMRPTSFPRIKRLSEENDISPAELSTEYSLDNTTLFVGSYSESTTQDDLMRLFSKFGAIASVKMIPQKKIAFVAFKHPSSVYAALKETDLRLGDRTLRVQQRKIINTVNRAPRENLELYGYSHDDSTRRMTKPRK